jgi:mannose-6-phosphate isomerase-like protein (cupin superfamily)
MARAQLKHRPGRTYRQAMTRKLRRIITGHNERGKSVVLAVKPPFELGRLYDMWETDGAPASHAPEETVEGRRVRLEPPPGGTNFRFFRVEPDDPALESAEIEERVARDFKAVGAAHCRRDTTRSPHMHETKTIDYIIVLEGRVTLLLDEDEVELTPFDVVIQRGTNHAWITKEGQSALLAAVLIDAVPQRGVGTDARRQSAREGRHE